MDQRIKNAQYATLRPKDGNSLDEYLRVSVDFLILFVSEWLPDPSTEKWDNVRD